MSAELLDLARSTALEAAELAARRRAEGVSAVATKSSAVDVVTAADREVEALIRARLAAARPDDGFYGEESGAEPGSTGLTWIVDPIDGTVNYLYGIPHYAVSIAVAEGDPEGEWRALAGCVTNPASGELFTARAGHGSWLDGRRLRLGPAPEAAQALVATGFSYAAEARAEQGRRLAALLPRVRDIRRMGSAALDLCAVATGRIDAYFETGLPPWDHAAGALVAAEAGARVVGPGGTVPARGIVAAGAPALVEELLALLEAG